MEGYLTEEGRNSPFPLPFCNVWVRAVLYTCIRKCCRVLPSGKVSYRILAFARDMAAVWYRMARIRSPYPLAALPKLNINFTGCAIDNFAAACYNGITRKGKEGKHNVCKDELEGSKGKVR